MFAKRGIMGIARTFLSGAAFRLHVSLRIHLGVDSAAMRRRFGKEYLGLLSSDTTRKTGLKQLGCASFRCRGRGFRLGLDPPNVRFAFPCPSQPPTAPKDLP